MAEKVQSLVAPRRRLAAFKPRATDGANLFFASLCLGKLVESKSNLFFSAPITSTRAERTALGCTAHSGYLYLN